MIGWMAWRLHRRGLVGWSVAGFLLSFFYGYAYIQAAGTTPESQAAFGQSVNLVAKQFAFLIPLPVHPETLGGYEQYKLIAFWTEMLTIWAALAGVAVGRGEEAKGLTDEWLAAGVSRARLIAARSLAFLVPIAIASFAAVLGISAVAPLLNQDANLAGELGKGLSMTAGIFACYALALLVAQLPAERQTATSFGVGVVVLLMVLNGIADTIDSAAWIGYISPFHWMERTTSGAPGGTFDVAGTAILAVAAVLFVGLSIWLFQRRDLGSGVFKWRLRNAPALRTASHNPLLRLPFTEGLWEQRAGLAAWMVGTLLLGATMVAVTKSVTDSLVSDPRIASMFARVMPGNPYASMLGFVWFSIALLLLAAYAVVQVSRWSTQDQEGRVEMLLSVPVSRSRVIIDRALEFGIASLLVVLAGYLGVASKLPASGLNIDASRLFLASALMWPVALAFGGLGVAVASYWPRVAVPVLGAFVVIEYFLGDLAPIFSWPGWVANLSIFHLFGNPIAGSVTWWPATSMLLVFVAGFAAALVLMQRRDVSSAT